MKDPNDSILDDYIARKLGDVTGMIKAMVELGWVPVTPERQPYVVNLIEQLGPALTAERFTRVTTPVFALEGHPRPYTVCTRAVTAAVTATDLPADLPNINNELLPVLVAHLRKLGHTHIFSVNVSRMPVHGYLPPKCFVSTRSATVKA